MHSLTGVALSLLLAWGPTNGFDPTSMSIIREAGNLGVNLDGSRPFLEWLGQGTSEERDDRIRTVAYFFACAFGTDAKFHFKVDIEGKTEEHTWRGEMGLAPSLSSSIMGLGAGHGARLLPTPDEGRWISACLMAFANLKGSHEYILLRANPPGEAGKRLELTSGERWTMGYPEGVFFADVLNFNVVEQKNASSRLAREVREECRVLVQKEVNRVWRKEDLERSYTLSLNLPEGYSSYPTDRWAPPNSSNGRTLDFDRKTSLAVHRDSPPPAPSHGARAPWPAEVVRVAERLGSFQAFQGFFEAPWKPTDPNYDFDSVCVADRKIVRCATPKSDRLRPIFVHAPRIVPLASATTAIVPASTMQAIFSGSPALDGSQKKQCTDESPCTRPFALTSVGEAPRAPARKRWRTLTELKNGQSVVAVLRFDQRKEGYKLDLTEPFTAIVRYRSAGNSRATMAASRPDGSWRDFGEVWRATGTRWEWMQLFPVHAFRDPEQGGRPAVKVKISGLGDGQTAPVLDVAGFVSGPPWCFDTGKDEFADFCSDDAARAVPEAASVPMLRRAPVKFNAPIAP